MLEVLFLLGGAPHGGARFDSAEYLDRYVRFHREIDNSTIRVPWTNIGWIREAEDAS